MSYKNIVRTSARSTSPIAMSQRRARREQLRALAAGKEWYVEPVGQEPSSDDPVIPDLLHEDAPPWGSLHGLSQLVRFAFEGGDCSGVFQAVVDSTPIAPTTWRPEAFSSQLFLEDLAKACFRIQIDGTCYDVHHALPVRLLSCPPDAADDTSARQEIFAELAEHEALRRDLEKAYIALRKLRESLEMTTLQEPDPLSRKLAILTATKGCIDALADGFAQSRSNLKRLRLAARGMRDSEGYRRLAQLLDLDEHMATVDVRLRLGADGRIRGLSVLDIRENDINPLLPGPVKRFFQCISALLRGYRYSENAIIVNLLTSVFEPLVASVVTCLAMTGAIEFYLGGLAFRDLARSKGLEVCLPEIGEAPAERTLEGIFNPLLLLQKITPVACDIDVRRHDCLLVLTGPNSGGKTRLLQAIAIVQCFGQAGLYVPARSAKLVRAPALFVSLVSEVEAAQVEGRLGTELIRIRQLFEELEPAAMAILDELCSGTNPAEGEAIFEMVVSLLSRMSPQVFISTHFLSLAERLAAQPPVESLSFLRVELDEQQCPTFNFVPGVASSSLANKVAARLGVTEEELKKLVEAKLRGKI